MLFTADLGAAFPLNSSPPVKLRTAYSSPDYLKARDIGYTKQTRRLHNDSLTHFLCERLKGGVGVCSEDHIEATRA